MNTREVNFPPLRWLTIFVPARTWWQKRMWWMPVIQAELEVQTPRDVEGQCVPWWFPRVVFGINNIRYMNKDRWFVTNFNIAWFGVRFGIGIALPTTLKTPIKETP